MNDTEKVDKLEMVIGAMVHERESLRARITAMERVIQAGIKWFEENEALANWEGSGTGYDIALSDFWAAIKEYQEQQKKED